MSIHGIVTSPKLYGCVTLCCQKPIPNRETEHSRTHTEIKIDAKIQKVFLLVLYKFMVMPDRLNGQTHEARPQESVKAKEQEISLIFQSYTIIDPWTVMIH